MEGDPFKLGLAEILLQKTRAASALPIYARLVLEFPTASRLAGAPLDQLARLLHPIGLSTKRANQLHSYAEIVAARGPQSLADWRKSLADIPGLGAYGARALACFGFGERVGIVDANVARVLHRVFGLTQRDPRAVIFQRYADEIALASPNVRMTNYALLDLAALTCTPKPTCQVCTLKTVCTYAKSARISHISAALASKGEEG